MKTKKAEAPTALRMLIVSIFLLVLASVIYTAYTIKETMLNNSKIQITTTYQKNNNSLKLTKEKNYLDFQISAAKSKKAEPIKYKIVIEIDEFSTAPHDKIHINLTDNKNALLPGFNEKTLVSDFIKDDYIIYEGLINSSNKKDIIQNYKLIIWSDDYKENESFELKMIVAGENI